ncbi:reverse transcriptase domain-containing protein [Tanacetum coccineum]
MTGVPRSIAEHRLNIREECQPIRQKRRGQAPDRNNAIQEEVAKLVEAEIIRRSIPGPRSQHARNQSLSRKSRIDDEATITPNIERSSEPKRKAGELKQILIQIREKVTPLLQNPQKESSKRGPFDGKGLTASTNLFRQSCLANPKNKLQFNGKIGFSVSACHKEVEEVLPSTPGGAFDITYRPRTSIRGQILVDFIAERPDEEGPSMEEQAEETIPEPWTLFTDESSCLEGSGAGLILTSPEGEEFTYALRFEFDASNNKAEYEALVAGLRIAEQMGVKKLIAKVDSRLVANQINGLYEAKEQSMTQYLEKAKTLIDSFKIFSIEQKVNRREGNPSISGRRRRRVLLDDTAGRISYERKSFLELWLRCVGPTQAEYVVKEIHEGSCSMHSGPRSVVAKAIRSGYYSPTMHKDARNIITKCDDYQTHRPVPRNPPILRSTRKGLLLNLDVLEEIREKAAVPEARNKAKMEKYYNAKVRNTSFLPGDFVYRSNEESHAKESGKLGPKWEGPYEVVEALGKGAYKLRNESGDVLPRMWNVQDLKKCYL